MDEKRGKSLSAVWGMDASISLSGALRCLLCGQLLTGCIQVTRYRNNQVEVSPC